MKRGWPKASHYFDRHGKRRWRYRSKGFSAQLGTEYGSDEFIRRYEAAEQRTPQGVGGSRTRSGSMSALIASWYRSPEFLGLADSTKATYRRTVEPLRRTHGTKRVSHLQRKHIKQMMAEKAETPTAANFLLRMVRQLLDHAVEIELRVDNPARGIKGYRVSSQGFHTWSEVEIAAFFAFHRKGTTAHTAMTLMLYTGAARGDAVELGRGSISNGRISYRRKKNARKRKDTVVDIPVHADLAAVLERLPPDNFTFLQTQQGKSRSSNGLGNMMREWCDEAGLPECSSHGLRKACARRMAEAGATANQIAAVTGHDTLKEVERYTRAAGRAGMADDALALIPEQSEREQPVANHPGKAWLTSDKILKLNGKK